MEFMHTENSNYENGLEIDELPAAFLCFSRGIYIQGCNLCTNLKNDDNSTFDIKSSFNFNAYQNIFKRFDFVSTDTHSVMAKFREIFFYSKFSNRKSLLFWNSYT